MSDQKTIASLVAQLSLDSAQFRKELDNTKKRMSDIDKKAKQTRDKFASLEQQMAQSASFIKGTMITALGALGLSLSVGKVIGYSDSWATLDNRLKLVSKTNEQLLRSQADVIKIANDARTPLVTTAELYAKITKAGETLGLTQARVANVTETISKSMAISGGSAQAQEAAITQLNQALASGVLRGQEFNSISEQAPRLLYSMADALGVNIGELRKMANDGELTADVVIAAIESQSDAIKTEFAAITPTVGQSMTLVENAMTLMIGRMDRASGGSAALTGLLSSLAGQISAVGDDSKEAAEKAGPLTSIIETLGGWALGASLGFDGLGSNIASAAAQLTTFFGVLSGDTDRQEAGRMIKAIQAENEAHQQSLQKRLDDYWAAMDGISSASEDQAKKEVALQAAKDNAIIDAREIFEKRREQIEREAAEKRQQLEEQRANDRFIKEWEREEAQREQKFLRIEEQHLTDMEALNLRKEEELATIAYWESQHTDQKARAEDLRHRIALRYSLEKEKLEKETATKSMRYDQMTAQQRISWHQRMSTALIQIGGSGAEKLFKINQGLALAQAAVALPTAVMESFKNGGGYPWGLIPAGLMLVEGLAQIKSIQSQKFDKGGSIQTPSLGGGSVPGAPLDNSTQFFEPEAQDAKSNLEISISLTDYSEDSLLTGKQVNQIFDQLNDALRERNMSLSIAS